MKNLLCALLCLILLVGCVSAEGKEVQEMALTSLHKELKVVHGTNDELRTQLDEQANKIALLENELEQKKISLDEKEEVPNVPYIAYVNKVNGSYLINTLPDSYKKNFRVVNIVGDHTSMEMPYSKSMPTEVIATGGLSDGEMIKYVISGTIKDVRLANIIWSEDGKYLGAEMTHNYGDLTDVEVDIYTYLPCGMPSEVFLWKDSEGNEYKDFISESGIGMSGRMYLSPISQKRGE